MKWHFICLPMSYIFSSGSVEITQMAFFCHWPFISLKNAVYISEYIHICYWVIVSIGTQPILIKFKAMHRFYTHLSLQNRAFYDDMVRSNFPANRGRSCKSKDLSHAEALKKLFINGHIAMWFPENCALWTHCPLLRHISKAYVWNAFWIQKTTDLGGKKGRGRSVKMQGSLCLSFWGTRMRVTDTRACKLWPCHQFLLDGNIKELYSTSNWGSHPTPTNASRRLLPQGPILLWVVTEPQPSEHDQDEQFPEIRTACRPTLPVSQALADLLE